MGRLGGFFPFPIALVQEGTTRIAIPPGGFFVPPAGQWLTATDANTQLQWWDSQSQSWQTLLAASQGGDFTSDGCNYRFWNPGGTLSINATTVGGSGFIPGVGPAGNGVIATISGGTQVANSAPASLFAITGGTVQVPTITQAGAGFVAPPMIVFDPPPLGGIQATASCILAAGGGIGTITMGSNGAGYASAPNVYVIPQPAYYAGGPSGGIVSAAGAPVPGVVHPSNAVPGNQNISAVGTFAQLTPAALANPGSISGFTMVSNSAGWSSTAPTVALSIASGFPGTISSAAVTLTVASAGAVGTVKLQPRVNQ